MSASIFDSGPVSGWETYGVGYDQTEDEASPTKPSISADSAPPTQEPCRLPIYADQKPTSEYVTPTQSEAAPQYQEHQKFSEQRPSDIVAQPSHSQNNAPAPSAPSESQFQMDVGYIISNPAPAPPVAAAPAAPAPVASNEPAAQPVNAGGHSVYLPPQGFSEQSAVNPPHVEAKPAFVMDEIVVAAPPPVQVAAPVVEQAPVEHKTAEQLAAEQKLAEEDATIERLQELDPFYQESITRFIVMIESEAAAETDQEKLKIFQDFMEQEYFLRGQRYPLAIGQPPSRHASTAGRTAVPVASPPAVVEEAKPSPSAVEPKLQSERPATVPPVASAEHIVSPMHSPPTVYQQPVQAAPLIHQEPAKPASAVAPQAPSSPSPPIVHQDPIQQQPVTSQAPVRTETPANHEAGHYLSAFQPQPASGANSEIVHEEPAQNQPPKASSPSPATYKPFRPSLATTPRPMSAYSPINPPVSPQYKPTSPRPESAYVGSSSYVPYKPGAAARRNSMPIEPKPAETYTAFRPGGEPAASIHGPIRRAGTTIDGMDPMSRPPLTKDETFLPVKEQASDDFFPSFAEEPEEEDSVPALAPLKPHPPITQGLTRLLPPKGTKRGKSPALEDIKKRLAEIGEDFSFIEKLAAEFDKKESANRRQLEEAHRKRQEEHSDYVDRLFSDNEIGYGDIGDLDDEFNKKEERRRREEEKAEYDRYVKEVFEPAYNQLQEGIKQVMDLHFQTGGELLPIAVAGRNRWLADGRPEYEAVLQMLVRLDGIAERRHGKVHETILARDRKYRKTVTEPLRAVNDVKKLSTMIKHFDDSERKLTLDAVRHKSLRTSELVAIVERAVDAGLEMDLSYITQITAEINKILAALPGPPSAYTGDQMLLKEELFRAQSTLKNCMQSAENLMKVSNVTALVMNQATHEVLLAEARVKDEDEKPLEGRVRIADEAADAELEERVRGLQEYGVVVGNLEMVIDGLKVGSPLRIATPASRVATPISVVIPRGVGHGTASPAPLSALERAKQRNQGGNVIPYE